MGGRRYYGEVLDVLSNAENRFVLTVQCDEIAEEPLEDIEAALLWEGVSEDVPDEIFKQLGGFFHIPAVGDTVELLYDESDGGIDGDIRWKASLIGEESGNILSTVEGLVEGISDGDERFRAGKDRAAGFVIPGMVSIAVSMARLQGAFAFWFSKFFLFNGSDFSVEMDDSVSLESNEGAASFSSRTDTEIESTDGPVRINSGDDTVIQAGGDVDVDGIEINLNNGVVGVARLNDAIQTNATTDPAIIAWIAAVTTAINLLAPASIPLPPPVVINGKIIAASGSVKAGD